MRVKSVSTETSLRNNPNLKSGFNVIVAYGRSSREIIVLWRACAIEPQSERTQIPDHETGSKHLELPYYHRLSRTPASIMTSNNTINSNNIGQTNKVTAGEKMRQVMRHPISQTTSDRQDHDRGAAQVVHGIGENLRGRILDAADNSMSTGPKSVCSETYQGRAEVEQGFARMRGEHVPGVGTQTNVGTRIGDIHQHNDTGTAPGGMPMDAGLGTGVTGAMPAQPFPPEGIPTQSTVPPDAPYGAERYGGNNRDFQPGFAGPRGGSPGGPGPAPDQSFPTGPGISSTAPQRLP
ncbi:hypothetical protein BXZ70DRAFT_1053335 [Cristinia sonorae]|uniref:Uncharacterized protein n=1 Tax=Cristinia sonorae TaxID=1940300 RepID=A0A8K0UE86_9AGAR|nr:hypothetical protein BXZ70DRAFT_1053335 [Cristinia sonorae]